MSSYEATIHWQRDGAPFTDGKFSRGHRWRFDGGVDVPASASPHILPEPLSVASAVDPEEAFVAALSSCHMLFFLTISSRRGYIVDDYQDDAIGWLEKDDNGRQMMTRVELRPKVIWDSAAAPVEKVEEAMHEQAHHLCFIANSVTTVVETKIQQG